MLSDLSLGTLTETFSSSARTVFESSGDPLEALLRTSFLLSNQFVGPELIHGCRSNTAHRKVKDAFPNLSIVNLAETKRRSALALPLRGSSRFKVAFNKRRKTSLRSPNLCLLFMERKSIGEGILWERIITRPGKRGWDLYCFRGRLKGEQKTFLLCFPIFHKHKNGWSSKKHFFYGLRLVTFYRTLPPFSFHLVFVSFSFFGFLLLNRSTCH